MSIETRQDFSPEDTDQEHDQHDSHWYYKTCLRALGEARRQNNIKALSEIAAIITDIESRHPEFAIDDDGRTTERDW